MLVSSQISSAQTAEVERLKSLRWSRDAAHNWQNEYGWLCGFNFLPSTAVNFIDMWHPLTFDLKSIEQELELAAIAGFNALRTNLQFLLWENDSQSYHTRIDAFLNVAEKYGLHVVMCLFDDCGFSGDKPDMTVQPDPVAGVHNSRAMASPGRDIVMDPTMYARLEEYVKDLIQTYAGDPRIICWDLYNEPGNLMIFGQDGQGEFSDALEPYSLNLLISSFSWARECDPSQPLTTGAWHTKMPWSEHVTGTFEHPIDQIALSISDVISYHAYCDTDAMASIISKLKSIGRPLLCTEWLARNIGSTIIDQLPLLQRERVGAFQWGLVRGRSQTHIPWPAIIPMLDDYEVGKGEWFHDVFDTDGQPFNPEEIALVSSLTGKDAID